MRIKLKKYIGAPLSATPLDLKLDCKQAKKSRKEVDDEENII